MEYQKITNLLGNLPDKVPTFITKKWIEVHDQSGEKYNTNKQIRFKTSMLRSDLFDFSYAYIIVKVKSAVSATDGANNIRHKTNKPLAFKNNAPFIYCISKINGTGRKCRRLRYCTPMNNLLECSKNYSKTSGSLWIYYRDELTDETNDDNGPNKDVINSKSFKYKTSFTGSTYNLAATAGDFDATKEGTKKLKLLCH